MFDDPLSKSVERLLRTIPDTWTCREGAVRTDADEHAAVALVAAGLVERRFGLCIQIGDSTSTVSLEIVATGEGGLALAIQQAEGRLLAIWYKQSRTLFGFRRRDVHIHIVPKPPDDWRLTHRGVLARSDLDTEGRSEGHWLHCGCRQRTLLFVLRRAWFRDRPSVVGCGSVQWLGEGMTVGDAPWTRRLLFWLVCTFRRRLLKDIRKVVATELSAVFSRQELKARPACPNPRPSEPMSDTAPSPLGRNEMFVLRVLSDQDVAELLTIEQILDAMPVETRLSTRTVQEVVNALIAKKLAERPHGPRGGVRLTTRGRMGARRAGTEKVSGRS